MENRGPGCTPSEGIILNKFTLNAERLYLAPPPALPTADIGKDSTSNSERRMTRIEERKVAILGM